MPRISYRRLKRQTTKSLFRAYAKNRMVVRKRGYGKSYANLYNVGNINTQICPQMLYTKLPFDYNIRIVQVPDTTISGGQKHLIITGNNLNPVGSDSVNDFPASTLGTGTPTSGDIIWTGLNAYAKLYDRMNILSNYTKVKFWSDSLGGASTNVNVQIIMIALPYAADAINNVIALPTSTLMSQKGAQCRMISGGGGKNNATISMKRSTKNMIGCKDVVDRVGSSCRLHQDLNVVGLDNPTNIEQWYYYVRVINPSDTIIDLTYSISSVANVKFSQRTLLRPSVANTNALPGAGV